MRPRQTVQRALLAAILWTALAAWGLAILWLSSLSPPELPPAAFLAWDKLNHIAAFAAGGWLAATALRISMPSRRAGALLPMAVLFVASFGAFDEMFQLLSPGRSGADLYDWIADLLGAVAGALLACFTHALLKIFITRR